MQPAAGPSGPPVAGPTGAPNIAGPTGPPVSGPSGPPEVNVSDSVVMGDIQQNVTVNVTETNVTNVNQFDPLAEIEDARARRQDREDRLEMLENKRNRARINVYMFLALTVILGVFSFFPFTEGDNDNNPQYQTMGPSDAEDWYNNDGHKEYDDKLWDVSPIESSPELNIFIPGSPIESGSLTTIRVDISVVSYRDDGNANTNFTAFIFEGKCTSSNINAQASDLSLLSDDSWAKSDKQLAPGESVEITLYTQPGQKCIQLRWEEPIENMNSLATMDVEIDFYWPRMFTVPLGILSFMMAGFAFIGAQKMGKTFKQLKYPEGQPEKKVEEEVLEAAEAEQRGDQLGVPEVTSPEDVDTPEVAGPSLAQAAASPEQDDVVAVDSEPTMETTSPEGQTETDNSASSWTDEQLLSAGWTQEQIDAMRNG